MKIAHGYFKDEEIVTLKTNFLRIVGEDNRTIFEVRVVDGHTIEICSGDVTKDNGKLYDDKMQIIPRCSNTIVVTKQEYKP